MKFINDYSKFFESYKIHGNESDRTLIFLHGGPGYRSDESYLEYFDLSKFNVILLNQKGGSGSLEPGSIENNTTQDLVEDIESLRIELGVDLIDIYGQSWGTTLGLAYAIKYPNRVKNLFLKGIFLGRKKRY